MTINITGRAAYSSAPSIEIQSLYGGDFKFGGIEYESREQVLFKLSAGELSSRSVGDLDEFTIRVRHEDGTDFEHDAAFVFTADGTGLKWQSAYGPYVVFTGTLFTVQHYPETFDLGEDADLKTIGYDTTDQGRFIDRCNEQRCIERDDPHLLMPYLPPKVDFAPRPVKITLNYSKES